MHAPSPPRPSGPSAASNLPKLPQVADQCFRDLETHLTEGGQVSDDDLATLSLLLGRNWAKALQLVDQGAVHCFQGEASGRRVFQVGGRTQQHTTLPARYCSCQAYHYEVVCRQEAPYCKHQLAARLAWLLRSCPVTPVDDVVIANMLLEM